ncbi:MAG: glycosyltransferase family 2 protein [Phycisphaerales bacterium]|nr:glycosyltransferase family 2 protein [Phycisphaerales bacterium]
MALIVNWNHPADTSRCLESLAAAGFDLADTVVVDNGSDDDSARELARRFPAIHVIENSRNLGFTGGYNIGIRKATSMGADYVLMLNDDATVRPGMLEALLLQAERRPDAALLGPLVLMLEDPQRVFAAGGSIAKDYSVSQNDYGLRVSELPVYPECFETDYLVGCVVLVRVAALERLGLLDEDFFAYYEDLEWGQRAYREGYSCLVVPGAVAMHPDTGSRDRVSPLVHYYMNRNQLLAARKLGWPTVVRMRMFAASMRRILAWSLKRELRSKPRRAVLCALCDGLTGRVGESCWSLD